MIAVKGSCNPGYYFNDGSCKCHINDPNVVRCDENGRYVFIKVLHSHCGLELCYTTLSSRYPSLGITIYVIII